MENYLKAIIPSELEIFPKLTPGKDPYYFQRWDFDEDSESMVLRYCFQGSGGTRKYCKRVFVSEMEALLANSLESGEITRQDFRSYCEATNRDRECGFAVIIAILESLGIAAHTNRRGIYAIVDHGNAKQLLGY